MKKEKNWQLRRTVLNCVLALLLAVAVGALAILAAYAVGGKKAICPAGSYALLALLLMLAALSSLRARAFDRRVHEEKIAEMNESFDRQKEAAQSDLGAEFRKLRRLAALVRGGELGVVLLLWLVLFLDAFGSSGAVPSVCGVILFYYFSGFDFVPTLGAFEGAEREKDFPRLYALARRAERDCGIRGKIHLFFTPEFNAGITRIGRQYAIFLGTQLLDICSEDECYTVLLHEFSHMKAENCPTYGENRIFERACGTQNALFNFLFRYPYSVYDYRFTMYKLSASVATELAADRALLHFGSKEAAASLLAKLSFTELFSYELERYLPYGPYTNDEPIKNQVSLISGLFKQVLAERLPFWRELREKELVGRTDSHPILSRRLSALGIVDYSVTLPEDAGSDYRRECDAAMAEMDALVYESYARDYAQNRQKTYLEPSVRFAPYRDSTLIPPPEEIREVLQACENCCDSDTLLAFCDRLIVAYEGSNEFALAVVYYTKALHLFRRYDRAGLELMYRAIAINRNYAETGYRELGQFIFLMGLSDEVQRYRENACAFAQGQIDGNTGIGELNEKDTLEPTDLPEAVVAGIRSYIESISEGKISHIYTARKLLKTGMVCYPWVVEFAPEADEDCRERVIDKIFEHLDTYPANIDFSLFEYDKSIAAALKKHGIAPLV